MLRIDELRNATAEMAAPALLRHLVLDKFPGRCGVTSSLRARSIVVLKMIAEIDRSTPVIFCHAPYIYPESVDYRALMIRRLGLTDVRDPDADETDALPGDEDHYEKVQTDIWGRETVETTVHLNRSLANFECWISAAYHLPYARDLRPRLIPEGRMVRVDPLTGWNWEEVHAEMARHDLPLHPRILAPTYHY